MNNDIIITSQPITSTDIQFRPKKFGDKIPEGLHDKFVQAVLSVNSMTEETALNTIWKLTYKPELVLRTFGFTSIDPATVSEEEAENVDFISEDLVKSFRNELRYQRNLISNFPEVSVPDSCKEAFEAFNNATGQDIITTVSVFRACSALVNCYTEDTISRTLALLKNPREENYFGGIRSLHFGYEEALYLKPYAQQIADLFSAMWEAKRKLSKPNTPMENLGQMLQEHQGRSTEQQNAQQPAEAEVPTAPETPKVEEAKPEENASETVSRQLTSSDVVANPEVFEAFLDVCNKVKDAGFDPVEVASKLDAISKILDAFRVLG